MEKKLLVVLVVVGLCSTAAFALDPIGPPTAGLKAGQVSAGLDYAYSQMDLEFDGHYSWYVYTGSEYYDTVSLKYKHKDAQMNKAYFNLGYGVADWLEVFGRLGGANLYGKRNPIYSYNEDDGGYTDTWLEETIYDSDTGFAFGFGAKATIWEPSPELKVGVLAQASRANVDYDILFEGYDYNYDNWWRVQSDGELDFWEVQVAVGATYKLSDKFSVYGGPFYYWFSGDFSHKGSDDYGYDDNYYMAIKGSYDVQDVGCFGGYLGAQIAATENVSVNAECQIAEGALALGTGLVWKF
jgi:hypothetical protein